jgi:nucleoside-diphosphate-sugar epimerase
VDLIDPDRDKYSHLFEGVDAVIHLAYKRRSGDPLDHFNSEKQNVEMAYNVFRSSYDAGVQRVVMASSNHAADWYEHALIHNGGLDIVRPYDLPLSDNFYGWAKATYEHMGFLFASGGMGEGGDGASGNAATGNLLAGNLNTSRKMGVVMVRIGAPRDIETEMYRGKPAAYKRDLGAYISPRDITQLFHKAMETPDIDNEYGVPWQVVYGISNNTRAFWSLTSARKILSYEPQDDSEITFRSGINELLSESGRVGPIDV